MQPNYQPNVSVKTFLDMNVPKIFYISKVPFPKKPLKGVNQDTRKYGKQEGGDPVQE